MVGIRHFLTPQTGASHQVKNIDQNSSFINSNRKLGRPRLPVLLMIFTIMTITITIISRYFRG